MMSKPVARVVTLATWLLMAVGAAILILNRPSAPPAALLVQRPQDSPTLAVPDPARQATIPGLFQGALLGAVDGQDFDQIPSYVRLLKAVRTMQPADFSARVTGRLNWADAIEHPDLWRGEFVRVRGLVGKIGAVKILNGDPGFEDVYRGYLAQPDVSRPDTSELVAFDFVDVPPPMVAKKDILDIEGIFYRTVRYESEGGPMLTVPWLIVRNVSVYAPPVVHETLSSLSWKLGLVLLVSVGAVMLVLRWSQRQRPRHAGLPPAGTSMRELMESRLRAERKPPQTRNKPE